MLVHLYGNPCEMDGSMQLAQEHNLLIIENVAEAFGLKYKGNYTGSFGDVACFSFFGNKLLPVTKVE
jgi:perosamine synthetase